MAAGNRLLVSVHAQMLARRRGTQPTPGNYPPEHVILSLQFSLPSILWLAVHPHVIHDQLLRECRRCIRIPGPRAANRKV